MRRMILCAVLSLAGCIDLAEERAENEARIGARAAAGLQVRVDDGLAAFGEAGNLWADAA